MHVVALDPEINVDTQRWEVLETFEVAQRCKITILMACAHTCESRKIWIVLLEGFDDEAIDRVSFRLNGRLRKACYRWHAGRKSHVELAYRLLGSRLYSQCIGCQIGSINER